MCQPTVVCMALTVFIVDDNRTFLAAAQDALATLAGVSVVGYAVNGRDALTQIEVLKPDMVLLDIGLPDISGIAVGMQLRKWAQPPLILLVSLHDDAGYLTIQKEIGALGFVDKTNFVTDLLPLLETLIDHPTRGTHK